VRCRPGSTCTKCYKKTLGETGQDVLRRSGLNEGQNAHAADVEGGGGEVAHDCHKLAVERGVGDAERGAGPEGGKEGVVVSVEGEHLFQVACVPAVAFGAVACAAVPHVVQHLRAHEQYVGQETVEVHE
jgi:hypothetical protein